ncbi:MAG: hypothetical protein MZU91_12725 [Desulfosudis oleivorans]|nr:hypothetical protein [Desulfosudis oleivorans]
MLIAVLLRQALARRVAARRGGRRAGLHPDDPVASGQGAHGRRHRDLAHRGEGAMAPYGAHGRADLGARETLAAQPGQAPSLGASASEVEAASVEARGPERARAVFDAHRTSVADLRRRTGGVEGGDTGRLRDAARAAAGCLRMGTLALQPSTRARQRYGRSALLDTQPAGQPGRACSTRVG